MWSEGARSHHLRCWCATPMSTGARCAPSRDRRSSMAASTQRAGARRDWRRSTPARPLARAGPRSSSRARTSPIWMDSSTTAAVRRDRSGARRRRASWRSSPARERSSDSPDRRSGSSRRRSPDGYAATDRIHLVSSWLASLLAGTHAADRSRRRLGHEPDGPRVPSSWSPDGAARHGCRARCQAAAVAEVVDAGRHARAVLAAALQPAAGPRRRLVRRQPVQPRRHRPRPRRRRRDLARHERHDLRHHADAAPSEDGTGPRVRLADRRLHGHDGLQERIAGARTRSATATAWTGPPSPHALARRRAGNRGATHAALVRSRDHAARARARRAAASVSTPPMARRQRPRQSSKRR